MFNNDYTDDEMIGWAEGQNMPTDDMQAVRELFDEYQWDLAEPFRDGTA